MSITKDQIIEAVSAMSVMDVVELISAMEEKFGVSAAAAVAVAAGPAEAGGYRPVRAEKRHDPHRLHRPGEDVSVTEHNKKEAVRLPFCYAWYSGPRP